MKKNCPNTNDQITASWKATSGLPCRSWVSFGALAFTLTALSHAPLSAEYELGDYGALAVELEGAVKHSSNIERNNLEKDDFIFQFRPYARYRFNQGDLKIDAYAGVNFLFYDDNDENDAEDFKSRIDITYPGGEYDYETRYDWKLSAGFKESTTPNTSVQQITSLEELLFDFSGRYFVSDNLYLRGGVEYIDLTSQTGGLDDVTTLSFPVEIFFKYSDELNFGLGYRFQDTAVSDSAGGPEADSEDNAFYFAVEGQVASTMLATVKLGAQEREFDDSVNFMDTDGFFADASLLYEYSQQTRIVFSAGSEFGTTIANETTESRYGEVEISHIFNDKIDAVLALGYEEEDYDNSVDNREDESYYYDFELVYSLIEGRSTIKVRSSYEDRSSSRVISDYDVFTFEVELKYLF